MHLIDTHTHLEGFARRGDLPAVLDRARVAGIGTMIAIGTAPDDWELNRGLAREHAGTVHYSVGLHPCSVDEGWGRAFAQIERFWQSGPNVGSEVAADDSTTTRQAGTDRRAAGSPGGPSGPALPATSARPADAPKPVALGEIGLDRFHLPKDAVGAERIFGWQRAAFAEGLKLAGRLGVPVVVHSRGAFRECVEMIDASGVDWGQVVFHCFSEGPAEMEALSRRGGRGSFTGVITYKNAEAVRAAAKSQGLERLMIETDAPYLAPVPHRGKPNEPAFVRHTAEFCAGLFGVPLEELASATTRNARDFFGI
jgi:TatD DNase family protein